MSPDDLIFHALTAGVISDPVVMSSSKNAIALVTLDKSPKMLYLMCMNNRPADRIRKLVTLAVSGDTPETHNAASKAREQIEKLDTELLDTLAGQREALMEALRYESRRLRSSKARATKAETGELVSRALTLFDHYERIDALIPAVLLLRVESGHQLTADERQQLDGPVENILDRWVREMHERKRAEREARRNN